MSAGLWTHGTTASDEQINRNATIVLLNRKLSMYYLSGHKRDEILKKIEDLHAINIKFEFRYFCHRFNVSRIKLEYAPPIFTAAYATPMAAMVDMYSFLASDILCDLSASTSCILWIS